jgi:transposase
MMMDAAAEAGGGLRAAAAGRVYVCPARDQLFLLPVSMREWLDEGHLAWFVVEVVDRIDTGGLHRRPGGCPGRPPYEPEMMVALLLYAYCCGIRSSRQIEAHCRTDAAFRVICGGYVPDHATIARFVVDHEQALGALFVEGLRLCAAAGLVDLTVLALDGTKIAANASLARNRDAGWIRSEIAKLMAVTGEDAQSSAADPAALAPIAPDAGMLSACGREGRLRAALAIVEREDAAALAQAQQAASAAALKAEQGERQTGRKPKEPHAALVRAQFDHHAALTRLKQLNAERERRELAQARGEKRAGPRLRIDRAQRALAHASQHLNAAHARAQSKSTRSHRANITDPDSRIMSTPHGWVQGYNAQAIVNPQQIVLACEVSQDPGDVGLYEPMNTRLAQTLNAAGITTEIELLLADAGYCSEHNLTLTGPDRLIATTKDWKQRRAARQLGQTNGPPPPHATPIEQMEHLLRTPQGTTAYAQRSQLIEPSSATANTTAKYATSAAAA